MKNIDSRNNPDILVDATLSFFFQIDELKKLFSKNKNIDFETFKKKCLEKIGKDIKRFQTYDRIFEELLTKLDPNKEINKVNYNQSEQYDEEKGLNKFMEKHKNKNIIQQLFYIPKEEKLYCKKCGVNTFQFHYSKYILIQNPLNEFIFQKIFQPENEVKKDKSCNFCNGKITNIAIERKILDFPEILIVIISPFQVNNFQIIQNLTFTNGIISYSLTRFIESTNNCLYWINDKNTTICHKYEITRFGGPEKIENKKPIVLFYNLIRNFTDNKDINRNLFNRMNDNLIIKNEQNNINNNLINQQNLLNINTQLMNQQQNIFQQNFNQNINLNNQIMNQPNIQNMNNQGFINFQNNNNNNIVNNMNNNCFNNMNQFNNMNNNLQMNNINNNFMMNNNDGNMNVQFQNNIKKDNIINNNMISSNMMNNNMMNNNIANNNMMNNNIINNNIANNNMMNNNIINNQNTNNIDNNINNQNHNFNNFNSNNSNNNYKILEEENLKLKAELLNAKEEIRQLKLRLENGDFANRTKMVDFNKITCVTFISTDQKIICGLKCLVTDTFAEVEEKLYKIYPEYRETNNIFQVNGRQVLRFKTIEENNIHEGQGVQLIKID